jgi:hypothetical protein
MENGATIRRGVAPPNGRNAQLRVFVYGFLKPGELAFDQVRELIAGEITPALSKVGCTFEMRCRFTTGVGAFY